MSEPADFLVAEVEDLLDAGRVGLYEFPQFLRTHYPDMPLEKVIAAARGALGALLSSDTCRLVWATWGDLADGQDAAPSDVNDMVWTDVDADPYLAVEPVPDGA